MNNPYRFFQNSPVPTADPAALPAVTNAEPDRAGSVPLSTPPRDNHLVHALRHHLALCQEAMDLANRENQALTSSESYQPSAFIRQRKDLLPRLEESLMSLSTWRKRWQELGPAGRAGFGVVNSVSQSVQVLLTRILLLDRENQQALMRRGMLPAHQLPAAAVQRPHCVADAYRRHARA